MKRISTIIVAVLLTASVFAQAPQKMNYQAMIRDVNGDLITNKSVGMKISILQDSITGDAIFVETHTTTTNTNGLITIEIGNGTAVTGLFSSINWANGTSFIKTETDPTGGETYTISGVTQLLSVPYALYAETSGSSGSGGIKQYTQLEIDSLIPTAGMLVYNTDYNVLQFYNGTQWNGNQSSGCIPYPNSSDAGDNQYSITNIFTTLSANEPSYGVIGKWEVVSGSGGSFLDDTDPTTTFSGTDSTAYVLSWSLMTQCDTSISQMILTIDTSGTGYITPSTLTLNTFIHDGTTYTITDDLTGNEMASLDIWGASGYTSDFKSSISISLKITDAIRPSTTVAFPLVKSLYTGSIGDASVILTTDSKPWYSEGGTLNVVVDSKGDISIHFTDVTFGDNAYAASTATVKGSGNSAVTRDYKGSYSIDSLGWDYTNYTAIQPVTENTTNTYAGFTAVNQNNISGMLFCFFQKGGISAGTYTIAVPTGGLLDVGNVGANEVYIYALVYYNSQTPAYHWGQSGSVIVTKSDGDVHFEFKDIPTDDGKGKTDEMTGSFDCKDL